MILLQVACDLAVVDFFEPVEPVVEEHPVVEDDPPCPEGDGTPQEGCVTAEVHCGSSLDGHTRGGRSAWSNDFYMEKFCAPIHHDWDGPERVYSFRMEPMMVATVTLESPCEDLDLFAASWPHEGCPDLEHSVTACEADVLEGDGEFRLVTQDNPQTWLLGVDGKLGVTGAFTLSVECVDR
ncbi:MAG TPA: hypothetical protein QGF58_11215 [Myxococcota bacterium]|nr:hypothetical protein [Myxococcota bacterium]